MAHIKEALVLLLIGRLASAASLDSIEVGGSWGSPTARDPRSDSPMPVEPRPRPARPGGMDTTHSLPE